MVKQLVEHVIKELVDEPNKVKIEVFHDGPKSIVEVRVAPDDFKRVIGKDGRIVKSLRSMINALATSQTDIVVDMAQ